MQEVSRSPVSSAAKPTEWDSSCIAVRAGEVKSTISFAQDSTIPALDERYSRFQEAFGVCLGLGGVSRDFSLHTRPCRRSPDTLAPPFHRLFLPQIGGTLISSSSIHQSKTRGLYERVTNRQSGTPVPVCYDSGEARRCTPWKSGL